MYSPWGLMFRVRTHGEEGQFVVGAVGEDAVELGAVNIHPTHDQRRANVPLIPAAQTAHQTIIRLQIKAMKLSYGLKPASKILRR